MYNDRIEELAEDLRNHVFETLDIEPELTGDDAGKVAAAVEEAYTKALQTLEYKYQCEFCDEEFNGAPVTSEETGKRVFCSDDCLTEALDEIRSGQREAKRQYELYGDDLDSWYR